MQTKTFKYQKAKRVIETLLLCTIFCLPISFIGKNEFHLVNFLLLILLATIIIFLLSYSYLLNESFEINKDTITIKKKIGQSIKIPFEKIKRVVYREEEKTFQSNQTRMTIFEESRISKIIVSEIDLQSEMLTAIEEQGKEHGFNVIHQTLQTSSV